MIHKKMSHISKKSKMIAATAFILGATALGGGIVAYADSLPEDEGRPIDSLVSKIAEKFGLNKSEVESVVLEVMNTQRDEMKSLHDEMFSDKLKNLVDSKTITQAQADLVADKIEELHAQRDADFETYKNLDPEKRRELRDEHRAEMEEWAEQSGLTQDQLKAVFGERGQGGMGMKRGFGKK
jgi:polyhydroxyalkanoate synthesis regulator phasin